MTSPATTNPLGQPIGFAIGDWNSPPHPARTTLEGRYCRLEPVDPARHASRLFQELSEDREGRNWTYLAYGPFADLASFRDWMHATCLGSDPQFYAICRRDDDTPVGLASYLRISPASGSIEVGHLNYAPSLQRSPAATEAMSLMMRQAFELGYRRYEWKCDALNLPSRRAAERLGFTFEGIFRQATIYKGRNRDTAWYSIVDKEWPDLNEAYRSWLEPANFDTNGKQVLRLRDLFRPQENNIPPTSS